MKLCDNSKGSHFGKRPLHRCLLLLILVPQGSRLKGVYARYNYDCFTSLALKSNDCWWQWLVLPQHLSMGWTSLLMFAEVDLHVKQHKIQTNGHYSNFLWTFFPRTIKGAALPKLNAPWKYNKILGIRPRLSDNTSVTLCQYKFWLRSVFGFSAFFFFKWPCSGVAATSPLMNLKFVLT